jgi:hypothetical protein
MDLFDEFSALTRALDAAHVDYAVAGGLAVAIWGVPRATQDIDLLVPRAALEAAIAIGRERGFSIEALPMTFHDGTEIRRLSKPAVGALLTLDLLLVTANLEPAWASRLRLPVDRGEIWVVGREALIQMKTAAGRPQDLADAQRLSELDR